MDLPILSMPTVQPTVQPAATSTPAAPGQAAPVTPANVSHIHENTEILRANYNGFPAYLDAYNSLPAPFTVLSQLFPANATVPLVDFSNDATPPVRCSGCSAYMNAYMTWVPHGVDGLAYVCNLCGAHTLCPSYYGSRACLPQGSVYRSDFAQRPELATNVYELIPTKGFVQAKEKRGVPSYVFCFDATLYGVRSKFVHSAAAAAAEIVQGLIDQGRDNVRVGIVFYTSTVSVIRFAAEGDTSARSPTIVTMPDIDAAFPPSGATMVPIGTHGQSLLSALHNLPEIVDPPGSGEWDYDSSAALIPGVITAAKMLMAMASGRVLLFAAAPSGKNKYTSASETYPGLTAAARPYPPADGAAAVGLSGWDAPAKRRDVPADQSACLNPAQESIYHSLAIDAANHKIAFDIWACPPLQSQIATVGNQQNGQAPVSMNAPALAQLSRVSGGEFQYIPGFVASRDAARLGRTLRRAIFVDPRHSVVIRVRTMPGLGVDAFDGPGTRSSGDMHHMAHALPESSSFAVPMRVFDWSSEFAARVQSRQDVCVQISAMYRTVQDELRIRVATLRVPVLRARTDLELAIDVNASVTAVAKSVSAAMLNPGPVAGGDGCLQTLRARTERLMARYFQYRSGTTTFGQGPSGLTALYLFGLLRSPLLTPPSTLVRPDARAAEAITVLHGTSAIVRDHAYSTAVCLDGWTEYLAALPPGTTPQVPAPVRLSLSALAGGRYLIRTPTQTIYFLRPYAICGVQQPAVPGAEAAVLAGVMFRDGRQLPTAGGRLDYEALLRTDSRANTGDRLVLAQSPAGEAVVRAAEIIARQAGTVTGPITVICEGTADGLALLPMSMLIEDTMVNNTVQPGAAIAAGQRMAGSLKLAEYDLK